jgi:hypothetical protein
MIFRQHLCVSLLASALLLAPAAVSAQGIVVGTSVTDTQGGAVGTITAVEGDTVVLRTDRHEVRLPAASFTATATGALFGVTRDHLNADLDRMQAQASQAFAVGSNLIDRNGAVVGPVTALDSESVTVKIGEAVLRLPRTALAPSPQGLVVGATLTELQAAATPAPSPEPAEDTASGN